MGHANISVMLDRYVHLMPGNEAEGGGAARRLPCARAWRAGHRRQTAHSWSSLSRHLEVPVKVNAWVDEGIAPLVSALNDFPRVFTVASCESDDEWGAYVMFSYCGSSREAACFASDLGTALGSLAPEFQLQVEWRAGGEGDPHLTLTCPPGQVGRLAEALNACRTTVSSDGMDGRAPHSSIASHRRHATLPTDGGIQQWPA